MFYDPECLLLWLDLIATHPSISLIRKTFPIQSYKVRKCNIFSFSVIFKAKLYSCVCTYFGKGGRMILFNPQDCKVINSKCPLLLLSVLFCFKDVLYLSWIWHWIVWSLWWNQIDLGYNLGCCVVLGKSVNLFEPQSFHL